MQQIMAVKMAVMLAVKWQCPQFVPSLSPALSQALSQVLSQDEEKDASIDAKGYKSEEKGIKVIVFCRKNDFPSLFRGKLANFVRVNYNKVQPQHNKNGK